MPEGRSFDYTRTDQHNNLCISRLDFTGFPRRAILWECNGLFFLVPKAVIENEFESGSQYSEVTIHREQCIPVDYRVAMTLLGWETSSCLKDESS